MPFRVYGVFMTIRIEVAVGVVFNSQGEILVAKRFANQHQGLCWEFPGGKIEPGESEVQALKRELLEEVGIKVVSHQRWLDISHDYVDKKVRLLVHKVFSFSGEPKGCLGQTIQWAAPGALSTLNWPQANLPIVEALTEGSNASTFLSPSSFSSP